MLLMSPDIETVLPAILRARLAALPRGWTVSAGRNRGTRPLAVTVQRAGGNITGKLDRPRLLINVYAPTDALANDLANDVVSILGDIRDSSPIVKVDASGPSSLLNDNEAHRFIAADAIVLRTQLHSP